MNATSGISIHPDLQREIASVDENIRFRKLVIQNETIVQEQSINVRSEFSGDLNLLQDILQENEPAYVLAKQDHSPQWLLITYVPDTAKVKDKMLYASSRSSLVKTLANPSTLSVSSKSELTPFAYSAHLSQQAVPALISTREKQMKDVQAAERADTVAARTSSWGQASPFGGAKIDLQWTEDAVQAAETFPSSELNSLLVLKIDVISEGLSLIYSGSCVPNNVSSMLPAETPAFALYTFDASNLGLHTIFIYSCPTSSPIKEKMLYSSSSRIVQDRLKRLGVVVSRKLETSDPQEVQEQWMKEEIETGAGSHSNTPNSGTSQVNAEHANRSFAKPRGPLRKNR